MSDAGSALSTLRPRFREGLGNPMRIIVPRRPALLPEHGGVLQSPRGDGQKD